jgi:putative tryptophan/tyrosine transport system substrate-binding protein
MKRREFITLLGGAAVWPLVARAQQPAMPVIGFLDVASAAERADYMRGFVRGLAETGYIEGQNVAIEYRWAEGRYDRLPQLAADLVRSQVSVIAIPGTTAAALAAKAATATIPIVFGTGDDPVKLGLVASLNHPGGNATGVSMFGNELVAKRLQLLRDLAPAAKRVAVLVNPPDKTNNEPVLRDLETAAIGLQILPFEAATGREIDAAFERLVSEKVEALFLAPTALFSARRVQVAILAARYALPATFSSRNFVEAGGLMSYGTNQPGSYRQVALYVGRILKGAKPAELPVLQPANFELSINLNTARALCIQVPPTLLAIADEVIE